MLYLATKIVEQEPSKEVFPTLSTYQSIIIIHGELPYDHITLPFYERVYLLSDSAKTDFTNKAIRLFAHPHNMTGIIHTYNSFELSSEAMEDGFLDLSNLQSYLRKTIFLPLEHEECMG